MGKWICPCGFPMNDHIYPDKNAYVVFSEPDWDSAGSMTDGNNSANREDIPVPTFNVYRCPRCSRLIVFGASNSFLSFVPEFDPDEKS